MTEIQKHMGYLMDKAHLTQEESDQVLLMLISRGEMVPCENFADHYHRACSLMKGIDEHDAPFPAVGIALKLDGIWTADRHFFPQTVLPVYSHRDPECREP